MVWLLLLLGCGETIDLETKFQEGDTLIVTDRVQNTVKSIERGVILEGLRVKSRRDVVAGGILGQEDIGWVERVDQLRVERAVSGRELVWDSSLGGKPPEELEGALGKKEEVRDVRIAADSSVMLKIAQASDLVEGGSPENILSFDDQAFLDVVDLGLLTAPKGEIRVGQTWVSELASNNHFDHQDHASRITVNWRVDRIDGKLVQLTHSMTLVGRSKPKEHGFMVARARGRGTLVFDAEAGVPTEYNEEITYTMASADSEVDQMVTRSRYYTID
ncbi:MAG: hypothetical protein KC912_19560 [Proteobacteria bacterium]|nr:hypothetical protein [Pseudomonadota bacterium]